MARKKFKKIYTYECSLTGKKFKRSSEAPNPDELLSTNAYYELNPDKDDRPENVKRDVELNGEDLNNE